MILFVKTTIPDLSLVSISFASPIS